MNQHLQVLFSVFVECNKHIKIITSTYPEIKSLIPLDEKKFEKLNDHEVRIIDQFIYRFSKLQDAMGHRLFPALLHALEQDVKSMPLIDILNKIEELGLLASKEEWLFLIKLRNEFSNEFSNETDENPETINNLFEKAHLVINTFIKIKEYSLSKVEGLKNETDLLQTTSLPV